MSKHHNPRNSMMPAPPQPNPEPERDTSPPMRAYAVNRTSEGWDLRVLLLPRDVVEQYTVKQNADVLPIVIAKLAMDIERVAEGRAGMEQSA